MSTKNTPLTKAAMAAEANPPQTLTQAHQELVRIRPCHKASLQVWLSYYQYSVQVYEQIAETDPGHEGEALYWADRERDHARDIEARIRVLIPDQ
ncbi:MAG TPA: AMED_5909 family protein [Pseudonocardiaceae bacterium]|nr:AMED_5909 family protein [Pseudonocardiaceae bacterium]